MEVDTALYNYKPFFRGNSLKLGACPGVLELKHEKHKVKQPNDETKYIQSNEDMKIVIKFYFQFTVNLCLSDIMQYEVITFTLNK